MLTALNLSPFKIFTLLMLLFVSSQQKQSPECQAQVQDQKKGGDQAVEARNIQDSLCLFLDVSVYF